MRNSPLPPYVGPAGARRGRWSAALLIGLIGLVLALAARLPRRRPDEPQGAVERVMDFIGRKPVTALGGAIAAGILAIRNPTYLAP